MALQATNMEGLVKPIKALKIMINQNPTLTDKIIMSGNLS